MRYIHRSAFIMLILASLLLGSGVALARPAQAQPARRWLAEPELLTSPKTIGPSGGQLVVDRISDILLDDAANGWATAPSGIFRLENGIWRRAQAASGTTFYNAIGAYARTGMWVVGSETDRIPPYRSHVLMLNYADGTWQPTGDVVRGDGTRGPIEGSLADVFVYPFGVWAVGGQPSDVENWRRPLLLRFDGQQWRDQTPSEWKHGYLTAITMVGANEGWASGVLGQPGGEGADTLRLALLHFKDGVWAEAKLPNVPMSVNQVFAVDKLHMINSDEGWAIATVTSYATTLPSCPFGYLLHYSGGVWSLVPPESYGYRSITEIALVPGTNGGWASLGGCQAPGQNTLAQRARFDTGTLAIDPTGAQLAPAVYALLDDNNQWAAAGGSFMRYSDAPLPTDRISAAPPEDRRFVETGHTIGGEFKRYYETHGLELGDPGISSRESLALFGYPVSEPFDETNPEDGQRYRVQYFERARFELHPENQAPYRVLLGRLGFTSLGRQRPGVEPRIPNPEQPALGGTCGRFPETGYDLCPPFAGFWQRSGGLPVYGFPITNARDEANPTDGKTYLTQWYERERLEFHPELSGTPYEVLLGLLGAEDLRLRGYLP